MFWDGTELAGLPPRWVDEGVRPYVACGEYLQLSCKYALGTIGLQSGQR